MAVIVIVTSLGLLISAAFTDPSLRLWAFHFSLFVLIPAAALIASLVLIGIVVRHPLHSEEMFWLNVYLFLTIIVCVSEGLQKLTASPAGAVFWSNFFTAALFLSPAALLFSLTYTNRTSKRFNGLTAFMLVGSLAFIYFNIIIEYLPYTQVKYLSMTPWGWDFATHVPRVTWQLNVMPFVWFLGLTGLAIARLLFFRQQTKNPILKRQSLVYVCGVALPIASAAIYASIAFIAPRLSLPSINSLMSLISSIILVYGVYRYHLTTISPKQFSETILSLMHESVVVLDSNYSMLYVNPTGESLLGVKAAPHDEHTFREFLTPASLAALQTADAQHAATNDTYTIDQLDIVRSADTSPVAVRVEISPLQLSDFVGRIMVLTDITTELHTRRIIEHEVVTRTHELNQARANLTAAISSLQQGFLLINAKGVIELSNEQAQNLLHMTTEEMTNKHLASMSALEAWHPHINKAIDTVLTHGKAKHVAVSSTDGSFFTIYLTPVLLGSQLLGVTIVIEDVTEQKILDRSKDEFFSIASHELRTPLTAIRGNMSLVKDYFGGVLKRNKDLQQLVDDSHAASIRLIAIVNDFLDSSRIEQGKMQFTITPFAMGPLIKSIVDDLKPLVEANHNSISLQGLVGLPLALADEARTRQIIYNIIGNANTHNEHCAITISGHADNGKLYVRIADDGKGISPENQKLLFHKFQQAGESILTRDNTKGTGMGLYISRLLAASMQGSVELEYSEVGKGAVFVLELPDADGKSKS